MYLGLSAPCIQSQRKPQPGCSAFGNEEHVLVDGPPYCAPQIADVAFHSVEHPSNCPNPPPGILDSQESLVNTSRWLGQTHGKIKLRTANVVTSVRRLHYHLLSAQDSVRERKLVAGTTVRTTCADGREAIC